MVGGDPESDDAAVPLGIAKAFDLRIENVRTSSEQSFEFEGEIVRTTSGTKGLDHWHTFLYLHRSRHRGRPFVVGNLGKFARGFDAFPPSVRVAFMYGDFAREVFARKFWDRLKYKGYWSLASEMEQELAEKALPQHRNRRVHRMADGQRPNLARGYRHQFATQRVRHFHGNGRALTELSTPWRCPFVSHDWMGAVDSFPMAWRMGSNWHRYAIDKLAAGRSGRGQCSKPRLAISMGLHDQPTRPVSGRRVR